MAALHFVGRVAREGEAKLPRRNTEELTFARTAVVNGLPSMDLNAQRRVKSVICVNVPAISHECAKLLYKTWVQLMKINSKDNKSNSKLP